MSGQPVGTHQAPIIQPVDTQSTRPGWKETARILAGFVLIYLFFERVAAWTQSLYGEDGILICGLVLLVAILVERFLFQTPFSRALATLGFGRPAGPGLRASIAICVVLLAFYPLFALFTGATLGLRSGWAWLALGLVLQGGIAEEMLWRGYLFRHLWRGRGFWGATVLTMLVMAAVHLLLFATLPFAVALTATFVSIVITFPLNHLFALDGQAIWGPALVHAVVQGSIKLVVFPEDQLLTAQIAWMLLAIVVPLFAFAIRRKRA